MDEVIRSMTGPQLTGFAAVVLGLVGGTLAAVAAIVAPHWKQVRQRETEAALKADLLRAGFTADEIERVVRATAGKRPPLPYTVLPDDR